MELLKDTSNETGETKDGGVESFPARRITAEGDSREVREEVAREQPVTIIFNNRELVTMLCFPVDLKYMAVGFLASEGLLARREDIRRVTVDDKRGVVRVTTLSEQTADPDLIFKRVISTGCGRGASFYSASDAAEIKVESDATIAAADVFSLVNQFQHGSRLYAATHGIHSAALSDGKKLLVFHEDIGRHNAIDKVFGQCLLEDIPTADRAIVTSGRITSEILHKVAKRQVPILISISAPTNLGVRLSEALGITLVASVRGRKMSVYTHAGRVSA
jgi:FdhD protein